MAITVAPTFSWSESPSFKTCLDAKSSIPFLNGTSINATSLSLSPPTTLPFSTILFLKAT